MKLVTGIVFCFVFQLVLSFENEKNANDKFLNYDAKFLNTNVANEKVANTVENEEKLKISNKIRSEIPIKRKLNIKHENIPRKLSEEEVIIYLFKKYELERENAMAEMIF